MKEDHKRPAASTFTEFSKKKKKNIDGNNAILMPMIHYWMPSWSRKSSVTSLHLPRLEHGMKYITIETASLTILLIIRLNFNTIANLLHSKFKLIPRKSAIEILAFILFQRPISSANGNYVTILSFEQ